MTWYKATYTESEFKNGKAEEVDREFRRQVMERLFSNDANTGAGLFLTIDLETRIATLYFTPATGVFFPNVLERFGFIASTEPESNFGLWLCEDRAL